MAAMIHFNQSAREAVPLEEVHVYNQHVIVCAWKMEEVTVIKMRSDGHESSRWGGWRCMNPNGRVPS